MSQASVSGLQERGPGSPGFDITEKLYLQHVEDVRMGSSEVPDDAGEQPPHQRPSGPALLEAESRAGLAAARAAGTSPSGSAEPAALQEALQVAVAQLSDHHAYTSNI